MTREVPTKTKYKIEIKKDQSINSLHNKTIPVKEEGRGKIHLRRSRFEGHHRKTSRK